MEKYCHHIKGEGGGEREEPSFGQFWEEEELFKVKVVMLRCWNNRSGLCPHGKDSSTLSEYHHKGRL